MPAKKKTDPSSVWIGASECAARTGITARALRIYEQQRLLAPERDSNGWRRYSSADLSRLNTIAVLKSLGLTLSQIQLQLNSSPSSLEGILRVQMEAWLARRAAAEEAIALVTGALKHIKRHREVPIDRMCELVRCLEMHSFVPDYQGLIAKHITSDDSLAWSSWWVEHPEDLAESRRYLDAQNSLLRRLKVMMDAGSDPSSRRVGSVMTQWEAILLSHHVRERAVRQMSWNYDVTLKWYVVGHKNRTADRTAVGEARLRPAVEDDIYTPEFAAFIEAAHQHSDHGKALKLIHDAAAALMATRVAPTSPKARQLSARFAAICAKFSLGDPLIHATFGLFLERVNHGKKDTKKGKAWRFLQIVLDADSASKHMTEGSCVSVS